MISSYKDPGHVKKSDKISFLKLNKYFDPSFLCSSCEILKPEDSRHCYICKKCVSRFDHHCQWINNCVGLNNHGSFILFLILQWFFLLSVVAICTYNFLIVYAFESFRPSTYILSTYQFIQNEKTQKTIFIVASSTVMILCSMFIMPVTQLVT